MIWSLTRRTLILLATALVGSVVVFALLSVLPGDAARVALGVNATPEALAELRSRFGTDRPLFVQYFDWISGIFVGDFGRSYVTGNDIGMQMSERVSITAWLVGLGLVVALLVAIPLGSLAAILNRHPVGTALSGLTQVSIAVPAFIAAILLINIFAVNLGWFPSAGWTSPTADLGAFLAQATLPIISIGLIQGSLLSRYMRSATLEVINEDYMRTARAKGISRTRAFLRHGLRNAAIPVVTVLGLQIAALLVDTIVIERVFVIPGLGSLLFDGIRKRDLLLVEGIVLLLVVTILLLNYLIDLVYRLIDPRVRLAR